MAMTDREIEALLAEARELRPQPPDDLMARILADAEAVAAEPAAPRPAPRPTAPSRVGWRDWLGALGGWPVVGGLMASTVAGLWIGAAQPSGLSNLVPAVWGEQVSVGFGIDEDPLSLLEG